MCEVVHIARFSFSFPLLLVRYTINQGEKNVRWIDGSSATHPCQNNRVGGEDIALRLADLSNDRIFRGRDLVDQTIDHHEFLFALRRDAIVCFVVVFQGTPDAPEHRSKCASRANGVDLQIFGLAHLQLPRTRSDGSCCLACCCRDEMHRSKKMPSRRSHRSHMDEDQRGCHIASAISAFAVAESATKNERVNEMDRCRSAVTDGDPSLCNDRNAS